MFESDFESRFVILLAGLVSQRSNDKRAARDDENSVAGCKVCCFASQDSTWSEDERYEDAMESPMALIATDMGFDLSLIQRVVRRCHDVASLRDYCCVRFFISSSLS